MDDVAKMVAWLRDLAQQARCFESPSLEDIAGSKAFDACADTMEQLTLMRSGVLRLCDNPDPRGGFVGFRAVEDITACLEWRFK